jgi:hypothetical protein
MANLNITIPNKYLASLAIKYGKPANHPTIGDPAANGSFIQDELTRRVKDDVRTVQVEQSRAAAISTIESTLLTDFGI